MDIEEPRAMEMRSPASRDLYPVTKVAASPAVSRCLLRGDGFSFYLPTPSGSIFKIQPPQGPHLKYDLIHISTPSGSIFKILIQADRQSLSTNFATTRAFHQPALLTRLNSCQCLCWRKRWLEEETRVQHCSQRGRSRRVWVGF